MLESVETHERDVLVIGAGGAGLRAAIEAKSLGASVGLVCKSLLGKAHTVMAEGGVAAALANVDAADDWKTHFRDTMLGGKLLNNWRMAQLHAQEAPDRVRELERWGAVFDRTPDGRILQRAFGGHSHKRLAHVGDRTGLEMIRTLQDRAVALGVDVFMECTVTRLLEDGGRVSGVFAYWRESGRFVVFKAKAVVLATGGIGKAYRITSNSWEYTGDGQTLALEAGAELIDMEFVQFHPTGMVWPPGVMGILVTEAVRGEGGMLRNSQGERFMQRYDPERMELSTRDHVARAIYIEVKEGRGSPHGGVFLDISHKLAETVKAKLPSMYHQFMDLADVDITKGPMEVGPTVHYMMGGVRVDADTGATTLPGLFAAGEVAGGMHGANRLGGNSLSDLLVFGRRAGAGAAEFARAGGRMPAVDGEKVREAGAELLRVFENDGENPYAVHRDLQAAMQRDVGIFRAAEDLKHGIEELERLKRRAANVHVEGSRHFNPGWHLARDLRSMIRVSEAVARSALLREESRGAHARLDFPKLDERLGGLNTVSVREGEGVRITQSSLPEMPDELRALLDKKPGEAPAAAGAGKPAASRWWTLLLAALVGTAAIPAPAHSQQKAELLPGLVGLDHVVIGANDVAGALAAYQRLGFNVVPLKAPESGGPGGLVDLGNGFLEFTTPSVDSLGKPEPFTFEGAVGEGWEVRSAKEVAAYLRAHGGDTTEPVAATFAFPADSSGGAAPAAAPPAEPTFTLAKPREQPISGTPVYFVEYDLPKLRALVDAIVQKSGVGDPTDHPNGAVELAYVTVAVSRLEETVKVLQSWGLDPKSPAKDERGAYSVEVPLPKGRLYLVSPTSSGGIDDFLEERRAKAPPGTGRYFEGAILSVGIGVEDLNATVDWLTDRKITYIPMNLPVGRVEVVQGAPQWGLRIEFVQAAEQDRSERWAGHRDQAGSGASAAGTRPASGGHGAPGGAASSADPGSPAGSGSGGSR